MFMYKKRRAPTIKRQKIKLEDFLCVDYKFLFMSVPIQAKKSTL